MKYFIILISFTVFLFSNSVGAQNGTTIADTSFGREYFFSDDEVTFFEATATCASINMTLLRILSAEEQSNFETIVDDLEDYRLNLVWLYGTDIFSEGIWAWLPNFEVFEYANWGEKYPRNWYTLGYLCNCATVKGQKFNYVWGDRECERPLHYVCYRDLLIRETIVEDDKSTATGSGAEID